MYYSSCLPNPRLHIADALRGIAVMGIILIHNVEHMNFYRFPEVSDHLLKFVNTMTWDGVFFAFSGKMYSIFALMFGLSFYIQNDNQIQRGNNFSLRFEWRMILLLIFGLINTFFYNGDILVSYSLFGMLMPLASRLNTKALAFITVFLLLQPIEIYQIIAALLNPEYQLINANSGKYFHLLGQAQEFGSFWESGWGSLKYGQLATITWNIENGRTTQLPGLFFLGMLIGRLRLFYYGKDNMKIWLSLLAIALLVLFPVNGLLNLAPEYISRKEILFPLKLMLKSWNNLAQTFMYVSGLTLLFYNITSVNRIMMKITEFGRSSMTNYFLQSILGSILYYGWGFGLFRYCGPAVSLLIGIAMVWVQYHFSCWWMRTHKHGPMEGLWKKLTWINFRFK